MTTTAQAKITAYSERCGRQRGVNPLTPAQLERQRAAFAAFAAARAEVLAGQCELMAEGGPEAVAEAAWRPGGPSREDLAARAARHFVPVTREVVAEVLGWWFR